MRFSRLACVATVSLLFGAEAGRVEDALKESYRQKAFVQGVPLVEEKVKPVPYFTLKKSNGSRRSQGYVVEGQIKQLGEFERKERLEFRPIIIAEGFKVLGSELIAVSDDTAEFRLSFGIPENAPKGSHPVTLGLFSESGEQVTTLSTVIPVESETDIIAIAAYNDFHGRILQTRSGGTFDGAIGFTLALDELKSQESNVLLVGAGDTIGATIWESLAMDDDPAKAIAKAWGTALQCVGNHEFDKGWEDMLDFQERFEIPQLGANIYNETTNEPFLEKSKILEIPIEGTETKYRIGFIGVTLESLPNSVILSATKGLKFLAPGPIADAEGRRLKEEENVDLVMCLLHQGGVQAASTPAYMEMAPDSELTEFLKAISKNNIDILMTGHTHQRYAWEATETLPPVLQTGSYAQAMSVFKAEFDRETRSLQAVNFENRLIQSSVYFNTTTSLWTDAREETPVDESSISDVAKTVKDIMLEAIEEGDNRGRVPIASSSVTWELPRRNTIEAVDGNEDILGALVADSMLYVARERGHPAVASFMNPGGIREKWVPEEGNIIRRHIYSALPFSNTLNVMKATGATIKKILENQWQSNLYHLQVSGIRFYFDETRPLGDRTYNIQLYNDETESYDDLVLTQVYEIVTNNYLAGSGDGFSGFSECYDDLDLGEPDNQVVENYSKVVAEQNDGVLVPPINERGIQKQFDYSETLTSTFTTQAVDGNARISVSIATTSTENLKGPFRMVIMNDAKDTSFISFSEVEYFNSTAPLTFVREVPFNPFESWTAHVVSEKFDRNPFPEGIKLDLGNLEETCWTGEDKSSNVSLKVTSGERSIDLKAHFHGNFKGPFMAQITFEPSKHVEYFTFDELEVQDHGDLVGTLTWHEDDEWDNSTGGSVKMVSRYCGDTNYLGGVESTFSLENTGTSGAMKELMIGAVVLGFSVAAFV